MCKRFRRNASKHCSSSNPGPPSDRLARRLKKNGIKLADDEAQKQQGSPSHHHNNAVTSDTASEVTLIGTENEKSPNGGSQLIKA